MGSELLAIDGGKPVRTKPFPAWPVYDDRERKALEDVLTKTSWNFFEGRTHELLEKEFAAHHSAKYGIAVSCGTAALEISMRASGIGLGDEVIHQCYCCFADAQGIMAINAVPIPADITPETYCIDVDKREKLITTRTKAIVAVHFGGNLADMDAINRIAKKHKLLVIEDACLSHGAEWKGKICGTLGDVGVFSFGSGKLMTAGEGGMIITNNKKLADTCRTLRDRGRVWLDDMSSSKKSKEDGEGRFSELFAKFDHKMLGWNYRMSEFLAGIVRVQLTRLSGPVRSRSATETADTFLSS